jgi:putative peptidoglycan lipid II flippase
VLGYVRDAVIAGLAGAGPGADAFFVAFRIPNLLRRLFAEGAFAQALVPVLTECRARGSADELRDVVARVAGSLGLLVFAVTAAGVVAAPLLVLAFAPGFAAEPVKAGLAAEMLRITLPYLFFVTLTGLAGGVLNAHERFAVPALTPLFLNLAMIGAALWLAPRMAEPVVALAWGVFAGGLVQLLFQLPFLRRAGLLVRPRLGFGQPGVRRVLTTMLPAMLGVSAGQIGLLLDTLIASFLETGSVSWLYYSERLMEFPLGVLAIALGTVILPVLSRRVAEGSGEGFSATLDWALRWTLLLGVPATVGLVLLAGPLLATLFLHGEMRSSDVYLSRLSLVAYGLGLVGLMLVKVLAPAFYSRQDTRTPVRAALAALLANGVMSLALVFTLAHAGLALATSLSAWVNAGLLYRSLHGQGWHRPGPGWWPFLTRLLTASGALTALLAWGPADLARWVQAPLAERLTALGGWVVGSMAAYFAALWVLGLRRQDLFPVSGAGSGRPL